MHLEKEIKFRLKDPEAVRRMLQGMGADFQGGGFEENLVFDTPDRSLFASGTLLRLRRWHGATLTLKKRPPEEALIPGLKVWDEAETKVEDFGAMARVLTGLGYEASFRYEKIRGEYVLDGVMACLDHLPFGEYLELEGAEEAIPLLAGRLGLDMAQGITSSYHRLNLEEQQRQGVEPKDGFTFADREQALAMAEQLYPSGEKF